MISTIFINPTSRGFHLFSSVATLTLIATVGCGNGGFGNASGAAFSIVTWATPAPISVGVSLSSIQLDANSLSVPGTFVYTPAAGTILSAGVQTLSVTFTPTDTFHYQPVAQGVSLTVGNPTCTWNNVQSEGEAGVIEAGVRAGVAAVPCELQHRPSFLSPHPHNPNLY